MLSIAEISTLNGDIFLFLPFFAILVFILIQHS